MFVLSCMGSKDAANDLTHLEDTDPVRVRSTHKVSLLISLFGGYSHPLDLQSDPKQTSQFLQCTEKSGQVLDRKAVFPCASLPLLSTFDRINNPVLGSVAGSRRATKR
jgi:hypothetical protein